MSVLVSDIRRMYSKLDAVDAAEKARAGPRAPDVEPLYTTTGPPVLKKNRRAKDVLSWGCVLLVLLCVLAGLVVVTLVLVTHVQNSNSHVQHAPPAVHITTTAPSSTETGESVDTPEVEQAKIVRTNCGSVRGTLEDGVHVYQGIPYALPPEGELRWKPPVAREIEPEVCRPDMRINATRYGTKCMQWDPTGRDMIGQEDCLHLNIWSPDPEATLPIMLFIHGGGTQTELGHLYGTGLLTGSGNEPGLTPTPELVRDANMVFVTFNYRLGPFGFLAVNVTDPNTNSSIRGNFGLMDQHLAMEWVRTNARAFGGDPDNITAFGLGAGASSILIHLASSQPPAFQRAWVASPSPHYNTTLPTAFKQNQEFLQNSACAHTPASTMHACIQALSADDVFSAYPHRKWENRMFRDLPTPGEQELIRGLIVADETFLTKLPYDLWSTAGDHHNVPLLLGNTAQETDDWPQPAGLDSWTWVDYETHLKQRLDVFSQSDLAAQAQQLYRKQGSPEQVLASVISDMREICPVTAVARLLSHYWREPVYRYVVTDVVTSPTQDMTSSSRDTRSPPAPPPLVAEGEAKQTEGEEDQGGVLQTIDGDVFSGHRYAYHGADMLHFFDMTSSADADPEVTSRTLGSRLRATVYELARTGQVRRWYLYPQGTMLVSRDRVTKVKDYKQAECDLWREHGMFPYFAWMS